MLEVHITRVSPTHHTFVYKREDGSGESAELETKTFLIHDFIHFCLETEANLKDGFFGLLDKGYTYKDLSEGIRTDIGSEETADIERVTGVCTGVVKGGVSPQDVIAALENLYNAEEKEIPSWATEGLVIRVADRYRRLLGKWNSLSFGETLELKFK